jgi:hypothetical protein
MIGEMMPAVNRLSLALEEGHDATRQIILILQQAEEDAANPFNSLNLLLQIGSGWGGSFLDFIKDAFKASSGLDDVIEALQKYGLLKRLDLPYLTALGPVAGLLDILENPDGDWAKSIGSGLIEEIGINLLAKRFPPIAIIMGANDINQFVKRLESGLVSAYTDLVSTNPAMQSDVYDFSIGPTMDAGQDFLSDPSLHNFGRWANTLNPTGRMLHILTDSDMRQAVGGDVLDLFGAGGNFLLGRADMTASRIDQVTALTVASFARGNDFLPDDLERSIDQGASRFIDQIANGGLIGGVNLPGVPFI